MWNAFEKFFTDILTPFHEENFEKNVIVCLRNILAVTLIRKISFMCHDIVMVEGQVEGYHQTFS